MAALLYNRAPSINYKSPNKSRLVWLVDYSFVLALPLTSRECARKSMHVHFGGFIINIRDRQREGELPLSFLVAMLGGPDTQLLFSFVLPRGLSTDSTPLKNPVKNFYLGTG